MNRDNAHLYLPLVQALAEGKTIQIKENRGWRDIGEAVLTCDPSRYRIKPEPKTAWYRVAETTLGLIVCNNAMDASLIEYSQTFKRWIDERIQCDVTE